MAIRTGWLGLSSNSASPVSLLTAWNQARSDLRSKAQSSIVGVTDKRELKSVTKLTEVSSEALSAAAAVVYLAAEAEKAWRRGRKERGADMALDTPVSPTRM